MGAAGRERAVEEFGWDGIARKTVQIYESLLTGQPS
jgi:starch synthase